MKEARFGCNFFTALLPSRYYRFFLLALFVAFGLSACVTESESERPRVRAGMSREDLRTWFGEPSKIERVPSGEDWYYTFRSWSGPHVEGSAERDAFDPSVSTVSAGASFTFGTEERPIHLSPEGYVLDPVPAGKIVGK